jgi:integrase
VSLAFARRARDEARLAKDKGHDPVALKKTAKLLANYSSEDSFETVAREWYSKQKSQWSPAHADRIMRRLERDLFPHIGKLPLRAISAPELLAVLRKIETRGAVETADRALMDCGQIWRYGVSTGRADRDLCVDLKGALTRYRGKHFGAIVDPKAFGGLLRSIRGYKGGTYVRAALQLAPLVLLRPGELRQAEWSEFDLAAGMWTVPAARMKRSVAGKESGPPHLVPLSKQAVEILKPLKAMSGDRRLVFPGERDHERPMSDNAVRSALLSLGYSSEVMTAHGFRASARTMLDEQLHIDPLTIEAQLAHAVKDANGRAYNRTQYIAQRTSMMQTWADYLDSLAVAE